MKNVCIIFAETFNPSLQDDSTEKFLKKTLELSAKHSVDINTFTSLPEAKEVAFAQFNKETVEANMVVITKTDDLNKAAAQIIEAVNRFTVYAVVTPNSVYLGGYGINNKAAKYEKEYCSCQLVTTLCAISEALLPENPQGEILYSIMKDPNSKTKEVLKMQRTIDSLEEAITRETRAPWDKHDCA